MAIVYRNGRPYLYKSVRRGSHVTSEYLGSGEDALLIDAIEGFDREDKEYERYRDGEERKESAVLERALEELTEQGRALAAKAMISAGYSQHHRSEWRKQRGKRNDPSQCARASDRQVGEAEANRACRGK
jgi:hypothetical protein